jgi:hypothetical protein
MTGYGNEIAVAGEKSGVGCRGGKHPCSRRVEQRTSAQMQTCRGRPLYRKLVHHSATALAHHIGQMRAHAECDRRIGKQTRRAFTCSEHAAAQVKVGIDMRQRQQRRLRGIFVENDVHQGAV